MQKVATLNGYNYYIGENKKGNFYNIVPINQDAPKAGYYSKVYILKIKNVPDLFPYKQNKGLKCYVTKP